MKTSIASAPRYLSLFTLWLATLLLLTVPARSQTTPVGGIARQFTVTNLETRQPIRMTDFAGKVLVLDFFAYWCGPCQTSSPDLEINVQQYYDARGGNANGVPVQCLAVSVDNSNPAATAAFIENAGLELAGEDPLTTSGAWRQFNETGGIPLFAIINCVEGSPSHGQWELIYKRSGYAGAPALRAVIDRVMPAPPPPAPEISVDAPGGTSLTNNGPAVAIGSVPVGASGSEQTFTIRNSGEASLNNIAVTLDGTNAGDFTLNTSQTANTLNGGATTTFKVIFSPNAAGTRNATVRIASNDSDENPFNVRLTGNGISAPELEVRYGQSVLNDTSQVNFGFGIVGQEGAQRTVVIHNKGNAPLSGVSVTIRGTNLWDFKVVSEPDATIPPGGSSPVNVSFSPTASGPRSASLRIASNDADEALFDVQLAGTGSGENVPIIEVRSNSIPLAHGSAAIPFGNVVLGGAALERTIVISNLGNAPLIRLFASLGGTHTSDFQMIDTPLASINPGENTTFNIRFQPTATGLRTATLRIISSDANQNPFDIQVTGSVTSNAPPSKPEISMSQGTGLSNILIDGKSVRNLGASRLAQRGRAMTFKITNTGTSTLNLLKPRFQGRHQSDFMLVENLTAISLAPGKAATFKIAFRPRKLGPRTTTLQVFSNDADESPFAVTVTGIGRPR
jgi:thiol-disulfide isomerase/thioredoxin